MSLASKWPSKYLAQYAYFNMIWLVYFTIQRYTMLQLYNNRDATFYQAKTSIVYVVQTMHLTFIGKKWTLYD